VAGFDEAWLAVADGRQGESVSPELRAFLQTFYNQSLAHPLDSAKLKKSLRGLTFVLEWRGPLKCD
jgi:hypothetical protein